MKTVLYWLFLPLAYLVAMFDDHVSEREQSRVDAARDRAMRMCLAFALVTLALSQEASAQYGGMLPRQPTGVPGMYATVPFNAPAANPYPLGQFTGTPFGGGFQQGYALGLYKTSSDLDLAAMAMSMTRPAALRQPGPKYVTLWVGKRTKMITPAQAFLASHPIR